MPAATMTEPPITDVLIIGGSHAGLSAALTLYRVLHTCVIFDSKKPRNSYSTAVRLTSTWENRTPEEMKEASRKELVDSGLTTIVETQVTKIERTANSCFEATDDSGAKWLGRKVLLATGTKDIFPDIPGYAELFAKGIYPCMFQFGFELRGSASAGSLAVDGQANAHHAIMRARDAQKFATSVCIYTNGNSALASETTSLLSSSNMSVDSRKIIRLASSGTGKCVLIQFEDGEEKEESFLVHIPNTKLDMTLVDQLGLNLSKMGHVEAPPPFCHTNVPGVYAAGDCAHFMKIIPNAMSMGAYAGCGLTRELAQA